VRPVKNFILVEILNEYGYRNINANHDGHNAVLAWVVGGPNPVYPTIQMGISMTIYETLQLYFMAMTLGSITGFAFATMLLWIRH